MMKTILSILILSTSAIVGETWTLRNGETPEMELLRTFAKDGVLTGEFEDKDGKNRMIGEASLVEADAKRLREFNVSPKPEISVFDEVIANLRKGNRPTIAEIEKCNAEKVSCFAALTEKYGTRNEVRFNAKDQADLYILLVKLAVIDFPVHGGWPVRSNLLGHVSEELETRMKTSGDPFLPFCAIFSSLHRGDVEHAIACYRMIEKNDPFLAGIAAEWCRTLVRMSADKEKFINATKQN